MNAQPKSETKHKTSAARLASARLYKANHRDEMKALETARNDAVRSDPAAWAKKLAGDKLSRKRRFIEIKEYDRRRDPAALRARAVIRNRIHRGSLARGSCVICITPNAHAHHEDYAKPFHIVWLCTAHHAAVHKGKIVINKAQIVDVNAASTVQS